MLSVQDASNVMNGLRVYRDLEASADHSVNPNFYSRRSGGPYYRWRYEEFRARWRWSRMHAVELEDRELVATHWQAVPAQLKLSLDEHYIE